MAYEATPNAAGVGTTTQVVVGLFDDAHQGSDRAAGFSSNQIGAAFSRSIDRSLSHHHEPAAVEHNAENWWEKLKDAFRARTKWKPGEK